MARRFLSRKLVDGYLLKIEIIGYLMSLGF